MKKEQPLMSIKLVATIVNRGHGEEIARICNKLDLNVHFLFFGHGTANSEILDYLGIGEAEKDIVITLAPSHKIPQLFKAFLTDMDIRKPGKGIVFTVPITGINSFIMQLLAADYEKIGEGEVMDMDNTKYELILVVVNRGYSDVVMDAAKSAGARGGTVIEARGIGYEEAEKFLGVSIQAEKTIVAILCKKEEKHNIMLAINKEAGLKTQARGVLISMPVSDILGINGLESID